MTKYVSSIRNEFSKIRKKYYYYNMLKKIPIVGIKLAHGYRYTYAYKLSLKTAATSESCVCRPRQKKTSKIPTCYRYFKLTRTSSSKFTAGDRWCKRLAPCGIFLGFSSRVNTFLRDPHSRGLRAFKSKISRLNVTKYLNS